MKYLLIVLFSFGSLANIFACSCAKSPSTFIEYLNYDYIIHAKIIEQVKYKSDNQFQSFYGITKLVVLESIKAKRKSDTLIYINNSPSLCGSSILHIKEGSEIILKGMNVYYPVENIWKPTKQDSLFMQKINRNPTISGGACDICTIRIVNGKAVGNITRNKWNFIYGIQKFIKNFSNKWGKTFYHKYLGDKLYYQKMKVSKVIRIIKNRIKLYQPKKCGNG